MSINKVIGNFNIEDKDIQLMAYKDTIDKQAKKIFELEEKIKTIQKEHINTSMANVPHIDKMSDEEYICILQLKELKNTAMAQELTLEETKKVDIYVKCLATIRNKPRKVELSSKDLTNEELHKMLDKELSIPVEA